MSDRKKSKRSQKSEGYKRRRFTSIGLVGIICSAAIFLIIGIVYWNTVQKYNAFATPLKLNTAQTIQSACSFESEPSFSSVCSHGLYENVNIMKNENGVMIEFMQVYADSNRFSITLSLKKDNQDIDTESQLELGVRTRTDLVLPLLESEVNYNPSTGQGVRILSFDTTSLSNTSATLSVLLQIKKLSFQDNSFSDPVAINLSVPFYVGKMVSIRQTADKNGLSISLEKVVVTPSSTRFYMMYRHEATIFPAKFVLLIKNKSYSSGVGWYDDQRKEEILLFNQALLD